MSLDLATLEMTNNAKMVLLVMAAMNNERNDNTRRQALMDAKARCWARMTERARQAFERRRQQAGASPAKLDHQDCEPGRDGPLALLVRELIAEAHRLRETAESKQDVRTALRGLDTALRAIALYARTTGEISNRNRKAAVESVATREEGIQTATELLLELATDKEIEGLIARLQGRLKQTAVATALVTGTSRQGDIADQGAGAQEPPTYE